MNEIKHYLVYLITNTVNGKIYVGKHETLDPDDDYMGSGTMLKRAQNKYGLDKFIKTILADFDEPWSMSNMEAMIVDEEFVKRKDTYNITLGGNGGFYYAMKRWRALQQDDEYKRREQQVLKARWEDESYRKKMLRVVREIKSSEEHRKHLSEAAKKYFSTHVGTMKGRKHTPEALQKQHETFLRTHHAQGEKNPQYGKHWWKDPNDRSKSMSIKEGDPVPEGWVRGRWDNTVRPLKQHTCHWCGATSPIDETPCKHPHTCNKYRIFPALIKHFGMDEACIGTEKLHEEVSRIKSMIYGWISVERLDILGIMHRVKYPHRSREMKKILQCLFDKDF